ncbi:unnamed protein product [Cyclocybe aegerita]|uniref:Uncharacterized protein n=1 Tax=Cyclocybe aegerita TaxID=1973307 RepID=A0A8S0XMQ7_CYCAE|nr:unnamed protein product [Cyclocybe aegerita]
MELEKLEMYSVQGGQFENLLKHLIALEDDLSEEPAGSSSSANDIQRMRNDLEEINIGDVLNCNQASVTRIFSVLGVYRLLDVQAVVNGVKRILRGVLPCVTLQEGSGLGQIWNKMSDWTEVLSQAQTTINKYAKLDGRLTSNETDLHRRHLDVLYRVGCTCAAEKLLLMIQLAGSYSIISDPVEKLVMKPGLLFNVEMKIWRFLFAVLRGQVPLVEGLITLFKDLPWSLMKRADESVKHWFESGDKTKQKEKITESQEMDDSSLHVRHTELRAKEDQEDLQPPNINDMSNKANPGSDSDMEGSILVVLPHKRKRHAFNEIPNEEDNDFPTEPRGDENDEREDPRQQRQDEEGEELESLQPESEDEEPKKMKDNKSDKKKNDKKRTVEQVESEEEQLEKKKIEMKKSDKKKEKNKIKSNEFIDDKDSIDKFDEEACSDKEEDLMLSYWRSMNARHFRLLFQHLTSTCPRWCHPYADFILIYSLMYDVSLRYFPPIYGGYTLR